MCFSSAIAQAGLSIAGTITSQLGAEANAMAQGQAMKQQATGAITQMNYGFQNYEIERQDSFDAVIQEITKVRRNATGLNSGIEAAIMEEGNGGRTHGLIMRSVEGDTARNIAVLKENYQRKSNEIDLNKETSLMNTKSYVSTLKPPKAPSRIGALLEMGTAALGAYTAAKEFEASQKAKGISSGKNTKSSTAYQQKGYFHYDAPYAFKSSFDYKSPRKTYIKK